MLVFGEKAIPRDVLQKGEYKAHCITLGEETHWGPVRMDIKPMFYVFHEDMSDTDIPIEDWIEQCLARIVISLRNFLDIEDPQEICEAMDIIEAELYTVIWGYMNVIEL